MRALLTAALLLPTTAAAFQPVTDRDTFVAIVEGKRLTGDGVGLIVSNDGAITGRGFGFKVSGDWEWQGRYFCRTLTSMIRDFPRNCQTVAVQGDVVRFQADQGTGDVADLTLR
ncbi:hypothetical protein SAMN05444004_103178 [Jannaschia faecimaris]|uniref:Dihydrodipicolinate reductase n=1 Tax=Jannaschia faecimaris TaxID=1244108 RepID=A0A1H3MUE6_9RHOB|nr:hypothetical protein [Jannaschia faecimaris]SDY80301.1 hypothetical protein SAMN05444004_103178 [Jannaschia faecimaris]